MIDCTCIFIGSLIIALLASKFFEMHVCCLHELFPFKKIPSAFVKALKWLYRQQTIFQYWSRKKFCFYLQSTVIIFRLNKLIIGLSK